jgi:hypothetical protein
MNEDEKRIREAVDAETLACAAAICDLCARGGPIDVARGVHGQFREVRCAAAAIHKRLAARRATTT